MDGTAQEESRAQPRAGGRARATELARAVGRVLNVDRPADIDFERWHDYVPVGDDALAYHPGRDVLSFGGFVVNTAVEDPTPQERSALAQADRAQNDPAVGGRFERGGGYYAKGGRSGDAFLMHDYPVEAIGTGRLREDVEYHANLSATWRLHWAGRAARIAHGQESTPSAFVPWDDERHALDADVSPLSGRARAEAVVRAYLAHRLVARTTLGRDSDAGRALGEVPNVYDGGDYYLRYDPAHDQLEAGVFVATPADLARLQKGGVAADRLAAALDAGAPVPGDRATPTRLGPAFTRPAPHPGGAAPVATAFVVERPPGRPDAPPLLYLTQRYAVAGLTPRALQLAVEPLLDYGTVWRHRWLWRAARMTLGTEPVPAAPLVRTPDDYGFDSATERLDAAPPLSPPFGPTAPRRSS